VEDETEVVVTGKVAVVLFAATVTEAGTVTAALLLESETDTPPVGAAALNVMLPVVEVPPVTLAGLTASDESETVEPGLMLSAAVLLTLP
jgi:hypothetical protein